MAPASPKPIITEQPQRNLPVEQTPAKQNTAAFTIQLASYKFRSFAEKEAARLKGRGIDTIVLTKGAYSIVCTGKFANKEAAMAEIKKKYKNAILRRL